MGLGRDRISVSLAIPIFNNAKTAGKLLGECYEILKKNCTKYEMLICDDGSTDETRKVIEKFAKKNKNVRVMIHKTNLGIAATLKDLYENVRGEYTVLFSVDGGWDPMDIEHLISNMIQTRADIVVGERKKKKYTLIRHVVSFVYNNIPRLLFGTETYDAGSIKIFKADLIRTVPLQSKSVFFEAELLIRVQKAGGTVRTIPVTHKERTYKTKSGVNYNSVAAAFWDAIKLRFSL